MQCNHKIEENLHEISWWKNSIFRVFKRIRYPKIRITVSTNALLEGWGASMVGIISTGRAWLPDEKLMYINVLELKPILLALNSFVKTSHKHIALTKWKHHIQWNVFTKFWKFGMDNYPQKSSFRSSHSRETKHSCWQGISIKSC